jgi:hypothetical protein
MWIILLISVRYEPLLGIYRLTFLGWLVGGAFIGAGILHPFKRAWLGAMLGVLAQLALLYVLVLTTPI